MDDKTKEVDTLIKKAAEASDSGDAMRFSQAALNAANAFYTVRDILRITSKG